MNYKGVVQVRRILNLKSFNEHYVKTSKGFKLTEEWAKKLEIRRNRRKVYETVIYGLLVNSTGDYTELEMNLTTKDELDLAEVFDVIEKTGNKIIRSPQQAIDRITIAGRRIKDAEVSEDWRSDLIKEIKSLKFISRSARHRKRYGLEGDTSGFKSEEEKMREAWRLKTGA